MSGCLVTDPIIPAPTPPAKGNTPPRIDTQGIEPRKLFVEHVTGTNCPATKFDASRVVDPDPVDVDCAEKDLKSNQELVARFFVTEMPSPDEQPSLQLNVYEVLLRRTSSDCDVLELPRPFLFVPPRPLPPGVPAQWYAVELLVSDNFEGLRDAKDGFGVDSYTWLVRVKAGSCQ